MIITLGEKIRNLREDANFTQSQLGNILNMTQRKIFYIERNQYEPSIQDIVEICNYFKISSDYLLGLEQQ